MEYKVGFENKAQVILFETELKGQLSDGYWENARPLDHWKTICSAKAYVAENKSQVGANFICRRKYDFAAKALLDAVGDRMLHFVKFYTLFPDIDPTYACYHDFDCLSDHEFIENLFRFSENEKYYSERLKFIRETLNVYTKEDFFSLHNKIKNVNYDMKMLRKDLRRMKEIINFAL